MSKFATDLSINASMGPIGLVGTEVFHSPCICLTVTAMSLSFLFTLTMFSFNMHKLEFNYFSRDSLHVYLHSLCFDLGLLGFPLRKLWYDSKLLAKGS